MRLFYITVNYRYKCFKTLRSKPLISLMTQVLNIVKNKYSFWDILHNIEL